MEYTESIIFIMEIIGTVAFAASGAMLAIKKRMDVFGVIVLGVVTAVGGGMIRDMVLCRIPSALMYPIYALTATITSLLLFVVVAIRHRFLQGRSQYIYDHLLLFMDALGLGIFTVVGVTRGISAGYGGMKFLLIFLGTITGVGGGLLRDVMAQEPPYILVKHIYACASILGAVVYLIVYRTLGELPGLVLAPVSVLLIRLLAAHYRWNLPRVRWEE
ncbi:MAG: trimeric intracellular cation channel family protein [Lachnospiraceae bacterium]|nr:trimeric intracellular cation channel family protein [Lachnospiraceae bacterium]